MLLSNFPTVIEPVVEVLEVVLRPEGTPTAAVWVQLYRLADAPAALAAPGAGGMLYFGPNPADVERNPFVLAYDADGVLKYLLMKESPEHPWVVVPGVQGDPTGAVGVVFDDPDRAVQAADLLRRLASPAGLSETDCWNLIRVLRQAAAVRGAA